MPNVKPLPVDAPADRHPAMVAADGIMAHVPGAESLQSSPSPVQQFAWTRDEGG